MKHIKKLKVHPGLGNDLRQEVIEWCSKQWGEYNNEDSFWGPTSNYERSEHGTFDVIFTDLKAAQIFLLRWGGQVVDVEYEETFAPDQEVLSKLFY